MNDSFNDFSDFVERLKEKPTKEQVISSDELLKLAEQDLESSRINYDGQLYNIAAYHLQQAVEKATKAYFTILGVLDATEVRRTGHDTPELFLRLIEKPGVLGFAKLAEGFGVMVKTDTSEAQTVVDKKKEEMARIDEKSILKLLSLIPQMETQLEILVQSGPPFETMNMDLVMGLMRSYILSFITFAHEEFTRYADKQVKPKEYISSLGIVATMLQIRTETEIAIDILRRIISSIKTDN